MKQKDKTEITRGSIWDEGTKKTLQEQNEQNVRWSKIDKNEKDEKRKIHENKQELK